MIRRTVDGSILRNAQAILAFSPGNEMIALGSYDGTISQENISGTQKSNIANETGAIEDLIYSPDGNFIISSTDRCSIRVWRASDGALIRQLESPTIPGEIIGRARIAVTKLQITRDGKYLFGRATGFGKLTIWNLEDGIMQWSNTEEDDPMGSDMSLSPDGTLSATPSGNINVYNIVKEQFLPDFQIPPYPKYANGVSVITFSDDGELLAAGLNDGSICVFRTTDFKLIYHFQAHHEAYFDGVHGLAFSPDNTLLASSGLDGLVKLWGIAR